MKRILLSLSFLLIYFYSFAQPPSNRGMYFDGVNDFATIPSLGILSNGTIELWIKPSAPSNGSIISNMGFDDSAFGYDIAFNSSTRKINLSMGRDGNRTFLLSVATLNLNQWYHIAYTFDGATMRLYIDGVLDNSVGASQLPNSTLPFRMGDFSGFKYTGQIDELRIFNIVRTQAEIASDRTNPSGTGLSAELGFWQFEQGTGQTITNTGFNGATNDGTLGGTISPESADPLWALRVKNTADSGAESLRDVITNANTLAGLNYIDFSIQQATSTTVSTITVTSTALPFISDAVIIDGYSAFGAVPNSAPFGSTNNAQIRIEINAPVAVSGSNGGGITLNNANNSTIKGLSVYGVPSNGLSARGISIIGTSTGNSIEGCFIGVYANGTFDAASRNYNGIGIGSTNNTIGWSGILDVSKFNVITNCIENGISIEANSNLIQGNYIGTSTNPGTTGSNIGGRGILSQNANMTISNNLIANATSSGIEKIFNGSNSFITDNIIRNNSIWGVMINGPSAGNNRIFRNQIFTNTSGGIFLVNTGNNEKPAPTITSATTTTITGTCTSCVDGEKVEVFDNLPGESQGRSFVGQTTVNSGAWTFVAIFTPGNRITATLTDATGNTSQFSAPVTVGAGVTTFFTLGNANWNSPAGWSSDGTNPCGCSPQGVAGATITIRQGHMVALTNNADLGINNTINIQDPLSTLEITANISTPIQTLNGQAGTRLLMRVFTFPPITTNNFATTNGTTVEFGINSAGTIPNQFNGNNYKSLAINGSGGAKNAGGTITIEEDFFLLGGDVFHVGGGDFTVTGVTTISNGSMFIDNSTGGINTFNGIINNNGVLSAIGGNVNVSIFNFNNDINNSATGTLNLDCNCQYNFNKAVAPPLLLQPGGQMIFGSNGGGNGSILSDLTIGDGALVTFNVTNAAQLLIANDKIVNNNNSTSGVMLNGNGGINGANANSRWIQGNSAQLYYNSDVPIMNTGIFDATSSNTVFYSRAGDQVIKGTTYHSVVFGGSGLRNVATGNFTMTTNLTIPSGITFQINGNNFTANGAVTIVGTFNDSGSGGVNTFNDIVQVNTGGTFAVIGSNTTGFIFKGNITNQGTFNLINSTQWVLDADLTIQNQSASPMTFADVNSGLGTINGNVTISDFVGGGNVILNANGGIALNGSLNNQLGDYPTASRFLRITHLNGLGTLTNATNAVVDYRSDQPSTSNFNLTALDNLFVYSFGNASVKSNTYHHLKLIGTGNKTLSGDIVVRGNLEIDFGASLNTTTFNHNITLEGNWIANGIFVPNNGAVTFSGTSATQEITTGASAPFNNLNINNNNNIQLNTATQANSISLTQGKLILGGSDFTLTGSPANQIVQSFTNTSTSYVVTDGIGRLIRNGLALSTPYVFPIGEISSIRHITVTPTTAGNMAAKFDAPLTPLPSPSFTDVAVGSWSLSGIGGSVTFFNSGCISTNSKVNRYNGSTWETTGITTTVALPDYTATSLNFAVLERYTILGTAPLVINPTTLPNGQVSISYIQTPFSVVAGLPPFTFSLKSGTLPDGLSLDGDQLTGFPTTAGSYTFTIEALDNGGNKGERTYTLVIDKGQQSVQSYSSTLLPDGKYELDAVFDSGLPASFLSTNTKVATIQGNILTLTSDILEGETEVLAFQVGDGNFQASDSVMILRINNFGLTTGLNDLEKNTKIYPNPATEKVSVEITKNTIEIQKIELLNLMGNTLDNISYPISQDNISISLKDISNGMYILKITTNRGVFLKRITKL